MKKIISLLLALVLMLGTVPVAFAATDEALDAADALHELGLFNGTGTNADGTPNYDLDRAPTRHEAVTMLVRLLGKEDEAKSGTWDIPFTDVADWAKPYVGYAYANGLTNGTSATTFGGGDTVTASQYLTFVLRALGYESGTDFRWNAAWELSDKIGLTDGTYNAQTTEFVRGDVAMISDSALNAKDSAGKNTLLDMLVNSSSVDKAAAKTYQSTPVRVRSIQLDEASWTMNKGEEKQLTATILPDNAGDKKVTWASSDSSVATVSAKGVVKAKQIGTAQITATASNGRSVSCDITVAAVEVSSVSLNKTSVDIVTGKTTTLKATVKPSNAEDKTVTWSSSNPSVATVSNGKVTGVKEGTAKITAKAGEQTAICMVSVTTAPIVFSGSGDKVITGIELSKGAYYCEYTHRGKGNFIVELYHGSDGSDWDLLANDIGQCSGRKELGDALKSNIQNGMLEVNANGDWTITIKKVSGTTSTHLKGSGDWVTSGYFVATQKRYVASYSATNDSNFMVDIYSSDGRDWALAANDIAPCSGEKIITLEPYNRYFIAVTSNGDWEIDLGIGDAVETIVPPAISAASTGKDTDDYDSYDSDSSDSNTDGGEILADYIMRKGKTMDSGAKRIEKTFAKTGSGGQMTAGLTCGGVSDSIMFSAEYTYKNSVTRVGFEYDYHEMEASSKITVTNTIDTPFTVFDSKASFDIAEYTDGTTLNFGLVGQTIGTVPDSYKELSNTVTGAAVVAWESLIREKTGLTLRDIGFTSY